MAKFITGNELNTEIEKTIKNAEEHLVLISPFIKLHHRFKSELQAKLENDKLEIIVVFGKNDRDILKSFDAEDLKFLKSFPNIEIRYDKRLHAKYYANEESAILTSMNLYDYSQDNNIEFGILTKSSLLNDVLSTGSLDRQAFDYFTDRVIPQSELYFKREPRYKSGLMGLTKNYSHSETVENRFDTSFKVQEDFVDLKKITTPGYCIRTGAKIKYNPKRPFTYDAYKEWAKKENPNQPEKYCHFSGEASFGETSYAKPILKKNWMKSKEIHNPVKSA